MFTGPLCLGVGVAGVVVSWIIPADNSLIRNVVRLHTALTVYSITVVATEKLSPLERVNSLESCLAHVAATFVSSTLLFIVALIPQETRRVAFEADDDHDQHRYRGAFVYGAFIVSSVATCLSALILDSIGFSVMTSNLVSASVVLFTVFGI